VVEKLKKKLPTRRDAVDAARLKLEGDPSHINPREDRLLREMMPEAHGRVVTRGLLAEAGRRGDDRVTLLIPEEAALLRARGGAGTRNPVSGLLEFYGDSPGTSGGGGGEGGDNGVGGPGNGSAGTGPGQGPGPGDAGYGNDYGGYASDYAGAMGYGFSNVGGQFGPNGEGLGISDISGFGMQDQNSIGAGGDMSNFASYAGALTDAAEEAGYAPLDTVYRLVQNIVYGPPRSIARNVPGRYSAPNKYGTGVMGTMTGFLTGTPMGLGMRLGMNMAQSMSPEAQERSMAENQAIGAQNSGGREHWMDDKRFTPGPYNPYTDGGRAADLPAGAASGAQTAEMGGSPGVNLGGQVYGATVSPSGQMAPTSDSRTLTGLPTPVENLLSDYIWRGRQGSGWGW